VQNISRPAKYFLIACSFTKCKEKKVLKALSDLSMEGSIAWKESFFIAIKPHTASVLGGKLFKSLLTLVNYKLSIIFGNIHA
jgi:hypothetical protein